MEETVEINIEEVENEAAGPVERNNTLESTSPEKIKITRLPLARVKHIMKIDPDCHLISQDALLMITKSTEMFLEHLSKEAAKFMILGKRKTVQRKDVDAAIDNVPSLCFLDGALE